MSLLRTSGELSWLCIEGSEATAYWHSAVLWPPCPYRSNIKRRKGNPYILFIRNDRCDHGVAARHLAITVVRQMIAWLLTLPPASELMEPHWEHNAYGDEHATDFSIFLNIKPVQPLHPHHDFDSGGLDRELAYFAMEDFCNLIAVYGAFEGIFELWHFKSKRATCTMHIFPWPKEIASSTAYA